MSVLDFEHKHDDEGGAFYLIDGGDRLAKITYQHRGGAQFVVDWVEVTPEFRGQGHARRLIDRMADFAREEGMTIVPTCGVTRSVMERHEEFHDVLDRPS